MIRRHQYHNASYQGQTTSNRREGGGILVDKHHNLVCSNWLNDKISRTSLVCMKRQEMRMYGEWKDGQMEGVNVVEDREWRVIGKYYSGNIQGKAVAICKSRGLMYLLETGSKLAVINRYPLGSESLELAEREAGISSSQLEFEAVIIRIATELNMQLRKKDNQMYIGYTFSPHNIGTVFCIDSCDYDCGDFSSSFVRSPTLAVNRLQSTHFIPRSAYFPLLTTYIHSFLSLIHSISKFQTQIFVTEQSEIVMNYNSNKSSKGNVEEEQLLSQFNNTRICETPKKTVALEQLNRSLEELLHMQEEMMSRKSRVRDSRSYLVEEERTEPLDTIKRRLYQYLENSRIHVIPTSRSKSKSAPRSPKTPISPKSILKSRFQIP